MGSRHPQHLFALSGLFAVASLASTAVFAQDADAVATSVLVMDLQFGDGITPDNAFLVTQEVATVLSKVPKTQVQTIEDIRITLGVEAQKQMAGCIETSCLAEIGQSLGTDTLLFGRLDRVGEKVSLQLTLLDSATAKPKTRCSLREDSISAILPLLDTVLVDVKKELNPQFTTPTSEAKTSFMPFAAVGGATAALVSGGAAASLVGVAYWMDAQLQDATGTVGGEQKQFYLNSAVPVVGSAVVFGVVAVVGIVIGAVGGALWALE